MVEHSFAVQPYCCSRFGCDMCGVQVQTGDRLRGCRICDYDVCSDCYTSFISDHGGSVLNRTLRRQQLPQRPDGVALTPSQSLESSFFEAARGLNEDGHTDSDEDTVEDDTPRHKVAQAELRYDHIKRRYVNVERPDVNSSLA